MSLKKGDRIRTVGSYRGFGTATIRAVHPYQYDDNQFIFLLDPDQEYAEKWRAASNLSVSVETYGGLKGYWFHEEFVEGIPTKVCPQCEQEKTVDHFFDYLCQECRFG
jgi:hypothetical protein